MWPFTIYGNVVTIAIDAKRICRHTSPPSTMLYLNKRNAIMANPRLIRTPALSQPTLRGTRTSVIGNDYHEPKSSDYAQRANQIIRPEGSG